MVENVRKSAQATNRGISAFAPHSTQEDTVRALVSLLCHTPHNPGPSILPQVAQGGNLSFLKSKIKHIQYYNLSMFISCLLFSFSQKYPYLSTCVEVWPDQSVQAVAKLLSLPGGVL